jgi:hypothetical protein
VGIVAADALHAGAILKALKAGTYYASCGPDFTSIHLDGNVLHNTCLPIDRIVIAAVGHRSFATGGDCMTEARIVISRTGFRVFPRGADRQGRKAGLVESLLDG